MPTPSTDANDPPRTDSQDDTTDAADIAASIADDLTTGRADRAENGSTDDASAALEASLERALADQLNAERAVSVSATVDVTHVRVSVTPTDSADSAAGAATGPRTRRLSEILDSSE